MRTRGVPVAALLLLASLVHQGTRAEDLYWEGEEDGSNEFLEVKQNDFSIGSHLSRLKRAGSFFGSFFSSDTSDSTDGPVENLESVTGDDENIIDGKDDDADTDGSGLPDNRIEPELREKTLRVTFVVMEPYKDEYSNRDSIQFQNFSKSLADAVNALFESLPGTQKASLVRIQSRLSDEFTCKVTLDIVTTGYEDTDRIAETLQDHIRNTSVLGTFTVYVTGFKSTVIDPGSTLVTCASYELQCDDGTCIPEIARCDGHQDCNDNSDEANCSNGPANEDNSNWNLDTNTGVNCSNPISCSLSLQSYCPNQRCDGHPDCEQQEDEQDCTDTEDGYAPQRGDQSLEGVPTPGTDQESNVYAFSSTPEPVCYAGDIQCDETRCISGSKRCDSVPDCDDGTDELGCDESCGNDDFRCDSGKCIASSRRCNRVVDCPNEEDERNCECTNEEFKCLIDGTCIELSKRCNGVNNCKDGSDEEGCGGTQCPPDKFTCDPPSTVTCAKRCDGVAECDGGEDEGGCPGCNHKCDGKCLPDQFICDSKRDCSDGSDEQDCDVCDELNDFRCNNGECIHIDQRCNNVNDCSDGEDERDCNNTVIPTSGGCSNIQFTCHDGTCIDSQFVCDGNNDCYDNSDEENCPCETNSWQCRSGQCIPYEAFCNGIPDCDDNSDEVNCTIHSSSNAVTTTSNPSLPNARPDFYAPPGQLYPYGGGPGGDPSRNDDSEKPNFYDPYGAQNGPYSPRGPTTSQPQSWPGYPGAGSGLQAVTTQNPNVGGEENRQSNQFGGDNPFGNAPSTSRPYPDVGNNGWPQYGGNGNDESETQYPGGNDGDQSENGYPDSNNNNGNEGNTYGSVSDRPDDNSEFDEYSNKIPNGNDDDENGDPDRNPSGGGGNQVSDSDQDGGDDGNQYGSGAPGGGPYGGAGNEDPGGDQNGGDGDQYGNRAPGGGQYGGAGNEAPGGDQNRGDGDQYGNRAPGGGQYGGAGNEAPGGDQNGGDGDQYGNRAPGGGQYGGTGNEASNGDQNGGDGDQFGNQAPGGDQYGGGGNQGPGSDQYGGYGGDPYGNRALGEGQYGGSGNQSPGGDQYRGDGGDQYGKGAPDEGQFGGDGNQASGGGQNGGDGGDQYGGVGNGQGGGGPYETNGSNSYGDNEVYGNVPSTGNQFGSANSGGPSDLVLKTVPNEQVVRYGGDAVFQCRDEGKLRVPVRWIREGGRPLKAGSIDRKGRLELYKVTPSDSGVYICQAVRFTGYPGSEVRVTLNVEPQPAISNSPFRPCKPDEATCGNGRQCIPKTATCDGKIDCSDGSDEDSCYQNGMCEPNQFQCRNHKCVLKTWLCDSEDDCGDNSDEADCNKHLKPGDPCQAVEFACHTGDQCVPKSFHCDGQADCFDNSDEIGCAPIYVTQPPTPSLVTLEVGSTLTLTCQAVGLPVPLISWRLNWGHVPPQCEAISENGKGTLTCPNMQHVHSGAYSCEAINNKGTTFAIPDSIVFVNKSDPCPPAYFNSEARTENECIRCFCFGKSQTCHSADLFLYNMPTPLGQGGTRLVGVSQTSSGDVRTDTPIGNLYHYEPQRNGASVTRMDPSTSSWSVSEDHPYVTLPESYNGKQLTSYGGHIKYVVTPHSDDYSPDDTVPNIIIKGKYGSLFHYHRSPVSREIKIEARLTPENWVKPSQRGIVPASREDIMMTLDHIEMILLRADLNNAGVIINDFTMESAHSANVGLGAASLVEECTCPRGYDGLSCEKCAFGFTRTNSDPWHGDCVPETCPPGTYGDPENGVPCSPCPCPLTSPSNQFASTCSLGYGGTVVCDCHPGYEGDNCDRCAPGFVGNPIIPGDSCKPKRTDNCNPIGTRTVRPPDECVCKENVEGRYCDACKNDSFYLSEDSRHGCTVCFCMGVTGECTSSNLRRKTTSARLNMPQLLNEVKIYKSSPTGPAGVRYTAPIESEYRADSLLSSVERSPTVYYWSLPNSFSGDKVTSYGGYLRYTLNNVPEYDRRTSNSAADVQLVSHNRLTFHYSGNFTPSPDGIVEANIKMVEKEWLRSDGKEISREHFLLALADVKTILIKVRYSDNAPLAMPVSASIDTAEVSGNGPTAPEVEQCICPVGYLGTSCEDCAPGYTRSSAGLYLKFCEPCQCPPGSSNMCNPETGACSSCPDNTEGSHCELCKSGYHRDPYGNCVESEATTLTPCRCDPRGTLSGCDVSGVCTCKQNVEGENCDRCRPGAFGLNADNPEGCLSCYCSGVTSECHEGSHYALTPMAAPIFGDNHDGYTLMDLNAKQVISDNYVPVPNESELTYIFQNPPNQELYWSLPVFIGNRVLSYGGTLSLRQTFYSTDNLTSSEPGVDVVLAGRDTSVYWRNPASYRAGGSLSYQVPISEKGWYVLGTPSPVDRSTFMRVLSDLRRVLVRATVVPNILYAAIADVSMDTATQSFDSSSTVATSVEVCMCPAGYSGTSCETCAPLYYKDRNGYCVQCPCNGHECQLDVTGNVQCNCRPPYAGFDCSVQAGSQTTQRPRPRPPVSQTTVVVTVTSPTIKIQEVGSTVNFTCSARSLMTPKPLRIKWSKVAGQLPLGRSTVDELAGLLLITNLQISDSGQYVCETNDGVSTAQAIATLKVPGNEMTMPVVEIRPAVNDYYVGDKIELECIASGTPAPSISWQRASNYPLPAGSEHYENVFIIESAREEDSGEYRCIASNTLGSVDRTAVITIRPKPSWSPRERLTISPEYLTLPEGQSSRVVCTGTKLIPADTIDWIRQDGYPLSENVQSISGVLYITSARLEDQGVYLCQSSYPGVSPAQIVLTIEPQGTPSPANQPNITVSLDSITIPTGEIGTVDCYPAGYPLPSIRWKKYDSNFGPSTSQRGNTLVISNAQDGDKGYYLCEGLIDGAPIAATYVFVEIERREAPRVEIWPQGEQSVQIGSQFEFHCRTTGGIPEPALTWARGGSNRPLSPHTHIRPNILQFDTVDVNDEGEYTCSATNVAGTVSASAVLKVRSAPEITITPSNQQEVRAGEPARFECRANGYPEPTVSIKTATDMLEIVRPTQGIAVLRIPAATERDEGLYVCTATSPAGTTQEQFQLIVDRGDGGDGGDGGDNTIEGSGDETYEPQPPDYVESPSSLYALDGASNVTIICDVTGGLEARWDRVEQPLQPNAIDRGSALYIYNVSTSDSGRYVCNLYDVQSGAVVKAVYTSLVVLRIPKITLRPQAQVVRPGQSPTVECVVEGDKILDIQWKPYNRAPSSRVEIRGSTLIFHQIEVEDAGKYECFARNQYANTSAIAEVVVSEESNRAPSQSHDNEQYAHSGAAVHLSCNVTLPNARIQWRKDGRPVPRSQQKSDGSLFIKLAQKSDSGRYVCLIRDQYGRRTSNYINLHIEDSREAEPASLVSIEQPRRRFRVSENVEVICRAKGFNLRWERYGTNQYVDSRPYGDGSVLRIQGVQESDAGVYRCIGTGPYGTHYDDFNLEVEPSNNEPVYPDDRNSPVEYTARLKDSVDLPCYHNLETPVFIEWKREFTPLPADVRSNQPNLHLESVTEASAGIYVCRVTNHITSVETRAILRVEGVVPRFDGSAWLSLPHLKDAYRQFDIEISFNPADRNGLILYNSENSGKTGDYIALALVDGVPKFTMDSGSAHIYVEGDRPLQLNVWHTIRISRINSRLTMDVDNTGPFIKQSPEYWEVLELHQPLYIGGVPNIDELPAEFAKYSGFIGCVSMLILGSEEKNIMLDKSDDFRVSSCHSCSPNQCLNGGVCQEASNERGFMCICAAGFAGLNCDRTGEACRPGLCGPGKCADTADGYKCACPVTYTGKNCEEKQSIEYPAFTGSAYLAIKPPVATRTLKMSMKVKPTLQVSDGIIMYCAETTRGYGGFTSLAVRNGKLEFRYDIGRGNNPVVLTSNKTLPANEWTAVHIARLANIVSLKINLVHDYKRTLDKPGEGLNLETPMFVGGVDDSIVLNNNTGVTGGFSGCIRDVTINGVHVDIVNSSIQSANVRECINERGDIPDTDVGCQCYNGGTCPVDSITCVCPVGFTGRQCETRVAAPLISSRMPPTYSSEPCSLRPCRNGGTCRPDLRNRMNHTCDCPLGFAGASCQMPLDLLQSVGFNGNGYVELPARLLRYDQLDREPAVIALAIRTYNDGVLLYQREGNAPIDQGDYILLHVVEGFVELEWDLGSGPASIVIDSVNVKDGDRHQIIAKLHEDNHASLSVDSYTRTGSSTGISNLMHADSNIYIGGMPDNLNIKNNYYPGLIGCIEQIELMSTDRGINIGQVAVAGRNAQRCRDFIPGRD